MRAVKQERGKAAATRVPASTTTPAFDTYSPRVMFSELYNRQTHEYSCPVVKRNLVFESSSIIFAGSER